MFITLEGIEGSGKSTQVPHIARHLERFGYSCLVTKEPGGTAVGKKIRAILLDPGNAGLDAMAELFLYEADRAQHAGRVIRPALEAKKTVICDRFADSTVVYQGAARGISVGIIEEINRMILGDLKPDITFLLDLPPEIGLSRAWRQIESGLRRQGESRFEQERIRFHEKVRQGYLALAQKEPGRIRVIDASGSQKDVKSAIEAELDRLPGHK
ncbi:MAG: dTMP kinase [Desulfobacteraceae bacterium]|nr:dTMP kinase [Desulfobacteraceae bacterium]